MSPRIPRAENKIDAKELRVTFSWVVKEHLHDLAKIAEKSEHFDPEMLAMLTDWAGDKRPSVHDVITALPLLAEQMMAHTSTAQDQARDVWRGLCIQLAEDGFGITQPLRRLR